MVGTDPPVCNVHGGRHRSRLPGAEEQEAGRRCTAISARTGKQCRMWAMLNSERIYGQALCMAHAGVRQKAGRMPEEGERRCTARTLDGKRCRRWAVSVEDGGSAGEDLCWVHAFPKAHGKITHGFFRQVPDFTEEQQAFIAELAREGEPLAAEVLVVRSKLQGLIAYLNRPNLSVAERIRVTELVFWGVRTVSRLLRAQRKLVEVDWRPGTAGGAGQLLERIVDDEETGGLETGELGTGD